MSPLHHFLHGQGDHAIALLPLLAIVPLLIAVLAIA